MRLFLAVALSVIALPAFAQQRPSHVDVGEAMEKTYQLGLQTGQALAGIIQKNEETQKWILDNWVPKLSLPPAAKQ